MKKVITIMLLTLSFCTVSQANETIPEQQLLAFENIKENSLACGTWSCQVSCGRWKDNGKNITYITTVTSSTTAAKAMMDAQRMCRDAFMSGIMGKVPNVMFGKLSQNNDGSLFAEAPSIVNDCVKDQITTQQLYTLTKDFGVKHELKTYE